MEGDDTLKGGAGDDHLYGGDKNNLLLASKGNDYLYGEEDNDIFDKKTHDFKETYNTQLYEEKTQSKCMLETKIAADNKKIMLLLPINNSQVTLSLQLSLPYCIL